MLIKKTRANNFMKEVFFKFQSMELTKIGLCNSGTALKILPLKPRQDLRTTTELLRVSSESSLITSSKSQSNFTANLLTGRVQV